MRRIIIFTILVFLFVDATGQWYKSQYNVESPDMLTNEQFAEAEKRSQDLAVTGGAVLLLGGASLVTGYLYNRNGLGEDPGFIEELLGAELMGKGLLVLGSGLSIVGLIAGTAGLIRSSSIRSAKSRFSEPGFTGITPVVLYCNNSAAPVPGISFRITF